MFVCEHCLHSKCISVHTKEFEVHLKANIKYFPSSWSIEGARVLSILQCKYEEANWEVADKPGQLTREKEMYDKGQRYGSLLGASASAYEATVQSV